MVDFNFEMEQTMGLEPTTSAMARRRSSQLSYVCIFLKLERGAGFEPVPPRVEALVLSLI